MRAIVVIVPALAVAVALVYSANTGAHVNLAAAAKCGVMILLVLAALGSLVYRANNRNDYIPPRPRDEW